MQSRSELAIKGGKPIRLTPLAYGRQSIDESDIRAVEAVLRSDFLTCGPMGQKFERALAEQSEMPECVTFSSATAALHGVMTMLGVTEGDRVVTTPITFAATSNSVLYCGGQVEFQDVEADTMNLKIAGLKADENTKAVVAVDYAGNPCRYDELRKLKTSARIVADACHSLGATYKGRPAASATDIAIYSFHPVKAITTGEGGAVLLRDSKEAQFLREFRAHGIQRGARAGFYKQEHLGFNYRLTDLQSALGLSQLERLSKFIERRSQIAAAYHEFFRGIEALKIPVETPEARSAWHLYPLRLRLEKLSVDRDEFLRALIAENIVANVHYIPVYWHPHYGRLGFQRGLCPVAEREYSSEISLPIFPLMSDQDIRDVCKGVEKLLAAYSR